MDSLDMREMAADCATLEKNMRRFTFRWVDGKGEICADPRGQLMLHADYTLKIAQLRSVALAAQALVRSVQPGLSPDTELVSEPALTALESALAAAGYDLPKEELKL